MKQRDYYFDNAKFILIFFVVFGHLLRSYINDSEVLYALYKVIYTFHMPAFILVSGFFAKGFYKKGYIQKIAKKLILPYLIFQIIYSVYYYFLYNKSELVVDPLTPHWSLWFLISLFFWNIMLIPFAKIKSIYSIALALILGLAIGYFDVSNFMSLTRTFVFFPLFLIGYFMNKEHFSMLNHSKIKITASTVLLTVLIGFLLKPGINYEWLLGSKPYEELGYFSIEAMLTRFKFYVLSLLMVFSFFALVPRKQYFFTKLGKNTLYVYLLHGFFIKVFRESEVQDYFSKPETLLLLAGISLVLTLILSSKVITSIAQPFIELKLCQTKKLYERAVSAVKFFSKKVLSN